MPEWRVRRTLKWPPAFGDEVCCSSCFFLFGNPTSMARPCLAVASWLCVPAFQRVCRLSELLMAIHYGQRCADSARRCKLLCSNDLSFYSARLRAVKPRRFARRQAKRAMIPNAGWHVRRPCASLLCLDFPRRRPRLERYFRARATAWDWRRRCAAGHCASSDRRQLRANWQTGIREGGGSHDHGPPLRCIPLSCGSRA